MHEDIAFDWDELLLYVHDRRVVPIVGHDLLVVEGDDGTRESLYALLGRKLGTALGVPLEELTPGNELADVAFRYLQRGGDRRRIYSSLRRFLEESPPSLPASLKKLAEITDFQLFVSTTFDGMMTRALDELRLRGESRSQLLSFSPRAQPDDIQSEIERLPHPVVYQIFGRLSASPDYVVTDEDTLEFICALHASAARPKLLLDELRNSHLLLLGCGFPDWLARFFIRTVVNQRLLDRRDAVQYLVDTPTRANPSLTLFLKHHKSEIYPPGDVVQFVDELHERWTRAYGAVKPTTVAALEPADMAPQAVFLSYASEDRPLVERTKAALEDAGLDVWLDTERLRSGDAWDLKIQRHIRRCSYFVPFISRNAQRRIEGYFRKEWHWALDRAREMDREIRKFIRPLLIDDVQEHDPGIPAEFWSYQASPCRDGTPSPEFIEDLREGVRRMRLKEAGFR